MTSGTGPYGSTPYGALPMDGGGEPPVPLPELMSIAAASDSIDLVFIAGPANLGSTAQSTAAIQGGLLHNLRSRLAASDSGSALGKFGRNLSDSASFTDAIATAWQVLASDNAEASDDPAALVRKLVALADAIAATDMAHGRLRAYAAVAVAAALEDRISTGWSAEVFDQAALADTATGIMRVLLGAASSVVASDSGAGRLGLSIVASSNAVVSDDPVATLRAMADLGDGAVAYCSLRLDGNDYQGWVVNTDLRAITEYRNVPFDSLVLFKGRTYAAGEGGIYQFGGDTDDGQPIEAWFTSFLTDFGTQKFKRSPDIWLGIKSDGELFVKVHTRDPDTGAKYEDWYRVDKKQAEGSAPGRAKLGRGLESTWWGLTVANVNGANFEHDKIEWRQLFLDRKQ